MRSGIVKHYTRDGITIVWKPDLCSHSTRCFHGLPEVFDPRRSPWVNLEGAEMEAIIRQVKQCPSGALRILAPKAEPALEGVRAIEVPDGPLVVRGTFVLQRADGSEEHRDEQTAFCRCGASGGKPFCDGSHLKAGFKG